MKKRLFLAGFLLLTPCFVFATSGACSGHGGVSCAAGQDTDGSVICNDGWRNSSVSYTSMKMCADYLVPHIESISKPIVPKLSPTLQKITPKPEEIKVLPKVQIQTSQEVKLEAPKTGFWQRFFGFFK